MFHGSPLLVSTLMPDSIYRKTQPIQWAPENFGDGTDPVLGDAYIEKWILVVPGYNRVFKVPTGSRISEPSRTPRINRNFL